MRLLPVIDLLGGQVVRGIAGRRAEYRPIASPWSEDSDPRSVAGGLRSAFGFRRFYVADLDGILSGAPNRDVYRDLVDAGFELLVDCGLTTPRQAMDLFACGVEAAIAGLESLPGPDCLKAILQEHGPQRVVFSLDLQHGVPKLAAASEWPNGADAGGIAEAAVRCGVERMIVLDLADVGSATGGSTQARCRSLRARHPSLRLIAGGGVRGDDDVESWSATGVEDLLVASALHDGRLTPEFVRHWT